MLNLKPLSHDSGTLISAISQKTLQTFGAVSNAGLSAGFHSAITTCTKILMHFGLIFMGEGISLRESVDLFKTNDDIIQVGGRFLMPSFLSGHKG